MVLLMLNIYTGWRRYLEVKTVKSCTSLGFKSSMNCTQLRLEEYLWQTSQLFSLFYTFS